MTVSEFRCNKKWSDKISDCFRSQGKQWNDTIEKRVKRCVADALPDNPSLALNQHKQSVFYALVNALNSLVEV